MKSMDPGINVFLSGKKSRSVSLTSTNYIEARAEFRADNEDTLLGNKKKGIKSLHLMAAFKVIIYNDTNDNNTSSGEKIVNSHDY